MPSLTIQIPMTPDRRLATNHARGRTQWSLGSWTRADREKACRFALNHYMRPQDSYGYTAEEMTIRDPVRVTITIYWGKQLGTDGKMRQARRLDWDSATSIVKAMVDGALVDTGILADDRQIIAGTVLQAVDPTGDGYTTIEIVPVAEENAA